MSSHTRTAIIQNVSDLCTREKKSSRRYFAGHLMLSLEVIHPPSFISVARTVWSLPAQGAKKHQEFLGPGGRKLVIFDWQQPYLLYWVQADLAMDWSGPLYPSLLIFQWEVFSLSQLFRLTLIPLEPWHPEKEGKLEMSEAFKAQTRALDLGMASIQKKKSLSEYRQAWFWP